MCGIIGAINLSKNGEKKAEQREIFTKILMASEDRGNDATGVGTLIKGRFKNIKSAIPAQVFVSTKQYKDFEFGDIVLGHTRMKTQGTELNNENNHPFVSKDFMLVHNGSISNDKDILFKNKLNVSGECDTEAILRLIQDKYTKQKRKRPVRAIQQASKKLWGSMAVLMLDKKGTLYCFKDSNPIYFAHSEKLEAVFIASEQEYLSQAFSKGSGLWGLEWSLGTLPQGVLFTENLPSDSGLALKRLSGGGFKARAFEVESSSWEKDIVYNSQYETDVKTGETRRLPLQLASKAGSVDSRWGKNGVYYDDYLEDYDMPPQNYSQSRAREVGFKKNIEPKLVGKTKTYRYNPNTITEPSVKENIVEMRLFLNAFGLPRDWAWYEFLKENYITLKEASKDIGFLMYIQYNKDLEMSDFTMGGVDVETERGLYEISIEGQ